MKFIIFVYEPGYPCLLDGDAVENGEFIELVIFSCTFMRINFYACFRVIVGESFWFARRMIIVHLGWKFVGWCLCRRCRKKLLRWHIAILYNFRSLSLFFKLLDILVQSLHKFSDIVLLQAAFICIQLECIFDGENPQDAEYEYLLKEEIENKRKLSKNDLPWRFFYLLLDIS